ncbi:MAG: FAD-dependent oxidoreductase [Desulfobulbaceae bacterium]|jgi:glycerol-3-phosphate dehydrogenase|nr:FAD-dependent oxidoreductase [Desulfobulbaceae bacterium]
MKRTIAASPLDLVVIGGGIQGATIAAKAAQAGFAVALFEKGDFASATSANSLKIIHGGIRYLQHGHIKRMRESIRSRREMMRLFPHLTRPLPCLMPTYGHGMRGREVMRLAFAFYDLIACDRNVGVPAPNRLPRAGRISSVNMAATAPGIGMAGLTGGALWYDTLAENTERLTLEYIKLAARHGALVANYAEVVGLQIHDHRLRGIVVRDLINGQDHRVPCSLAVNAAGAWLNQMMERAEEAIFPPPRFNFPRRQWAIAINLIVRKNLFGDYAVGLEGEAVHADHYATVPCGKRLFFFAPWRGRHTIIGTNYSRYDGRAEDFQARPEDIQKMIDDVNRIYPQAALKVEDVGFFHAGLLPIAASDDGYDETPQLESKGRIIDHAQDGATGLFSAIGVKYTTAPDLAEKVTRQLGKTHLAQAIRLNRYQSGDTGREKLDFAPAIAALGAEYETIRALLQSRYGEDWREVFRYLAANPDEAAAPWLIPGLLRAELRYFIHEEMAARLADVVFRRADLAAAECPAPDVLETVAQAMAVELAWNQEEIQRQIAAVEAVFEPLMVLHRCKKP